MMAWCNQNAGFIAALQTIATIAVSVIAVVISIHFSRLQFKISLKIYSAYLPDNNGDNNLISLLVYNNGNVPLNIKCINAYYVYKGSQEKIGCYAIYDNEHDEGYMLPRTDKPFSVPLDAKLVNSKKENSYMRVKVITKERKRPFTVKQSWVAG